MKNARGEGEKLVCGSCIWKMYLDMYVEVNEANERAPEIIRD